MTTYRPSPTVETGEAGRKILFTVHVSRSRTTYSKPLAEEME
jgi:hypothetical protein